jgi:hypothetical protein
MKMGETVACVFDATLIPAHAERLAWRTTDHDIGLWKVEADLQLHGGALAAQVVAVAHGRRAVHLEADGLEADGLKVLEVCLGVPPPQVQAGAGSPLQLRALITGLAEFPLRSVTRSTRKPARTEPTQHDVIGTTDVEVAHGRQHAFPSPQVLLQECCL